MAAMQPLMTSFFDRIPVNGSAHQMYAAWAPLVSHPEEVFAMDWLTETTLKDLEQIASAGDYIPRSLWEQEGRVRLPEVCAAVASTGD